MVTADDSAIGILALAYLPALIRIAPVRLVDPRVPIFALRGAWERYSRCLMTPMQGSFVNVVCTEPERWAWTQRIAAPVKPRDGREVATLEAVDNDGEVIEESVETEVIEEQVELYTAIGERTKCLRNVLIAHPPTESLYEAGLHPVIAKYEAVVVPVATAAFVAPTYLFPPPVADHARFRTIIKGA